MTDVAPPVRLERQPTGIRRLDDILMGGLLSGGTYAVTGPPGSGKTVLGNQCCFSHVREGGRAVFVTLLAESHARMLAQLRSMAFFDEAVIPSRLLYVNAYRTLEETRLPGLLDLLRRTVREHRASLLVVDGLETAECYSESQLGYQRFVRELQTHAGMLDCTTLLLTLSGGSRDHVENTIVDGVLELQLQLVGPRAVRDLTVHKFRGSSYLLGRHEVEIDRNGLVVHPRTEVHFGAPPERAAEDRIRMPFGIPSFDQMLEGGVLSGSTTTLLGAPGTGKTLLGLQFLAEGAARGQPGVYFGFYETPPRLVEKAESVGIHLRQAVESGLVEIQWQPPLEYNLDALAERLLERIRERRVDRLRVFVDGVAGFRGAAIYPERLPRFYAALTHELRALDATTIFSEETGLFHTEIDTQSGMGSLVENILLLRYVELRSQLYRLMSILKCRESGYDPTIREFAISAEGLRVASSFESAEAILSGQARQTPSFMQPRSARKATLTAGEQGAMAKARAARGQTQRAKKAPAKKAPAKKQPVKKTAAKKTAPSRSSRATRRKG